MAALDHLQTLGLSEFSARVMAGSWETIAVSFVCVGVFLVAVRWLAHGTWQAKPPGPAGLPVIGHLHMLGELPHISLAQVAKKYGELISIRLGSMPAVVASSPAMARAIMQTNDKAFASRPRTAASKYCLFDSSNLGYAPYGPYWKLMRQICVTDLFHARRMEFFRPTRMDELRGLLRSVASDVALRPGDPNIVLRPKLQSATNNIISRMMLGRKFSELSSYSSDPTTSVVALLNEILHLLGVFNVGDYVPALAWLDLQGYVKRMKVAGRKVQNALGEIVNTRREERRAHPGWEDKDLLDILLTTAAEETPKQPVKITDENVTGIILGMFLAGSDTSSISIEFALAELLVNPKTMARLRDELDTVLGTSRLVEEYDLPKLPYLQAVVKETMRLHPATPLLLPYESVEPCRILDYFIAAGTRGMINVWAIGRDPSVWENPLQFSPERFMDKPDFNLGGTNFELTPFGSGRRMCAGWQLGLLNVCMMLAGLVQCFDCHLPPSIYGSPGKVDMSEHPGLTVMMANSLFTTITPRLNLYDQN